MASKFDALRLLPLAILTVLINLAYITWPVSKQSSRTKSATSAVPSQNLSKSTVCLDTNKPTAGLKGLSWRPTQPSWRYINVSWNHDQFTFVLNKQNLCAGSPLLVAIVCSDVRNTDLRDSVRRTWGNDETEPEMKILFLVGLSSDPTFASRIQEEEELNGDILQADFIDTYGNLTLKSTMMLRWMVTYCSGAKFLLKADDDTFINIRLLLRDLRSTIHRRFIMGNVIALARPVRQRTAKWYTPTSAFNRSAYPTYVSGAAYVISGDAVADLYRASMTVPFFWIEDVYVTGLLAREASLQLIFNGKFDGFKDLRNVCSMHSHTVRHRMSPEQMQFLWSIVSRDGKQLDCV